MSCWKDDWMEKRPKSSRRTFTAQEKAQAVKIARSAERPIRRVAVELGISEKTLWQWVNEARLREIDPEGALTPQARARIRDLEAENAGLRRDLEFQKKAAAFFREIDRGESGSS